jgi:hypothetical protein
MSLTPAEKDIPLPGKIAIISQHMGIGYYYAIRCQGKNFWSFSC